MKVEIVQLVLQVQIDGTLISVERLADRSILAEGMFVVPTKNQLAIACATYEAAEKGSGRPWVEVS